MVVELVSNRPLDLPSPKCTYLHSPIFRYLYKEKQIIDFKKNGSGTGFKETFGSPISAMHFWALTHLQTVMCPSIEECQSVPVSKRTWSLYATTTKHLNLFFSWEFTFSHIFGHILCRLVSMFAYNTSGVSCFEPMMIKFQNKYNT